MPATAVRLFLLAVIKSLCMLCRAVLCLLLCVLLLCCSRRQGGDDLQMIKRGIMEVADIVAVNKGDGETEKAAERAAAEYSSCLHLMPHRWGPCTAVGQDCQSRRGCMLHVWFAFDCQPPGVVLLAVWGWQCQLGTCAMQRHVKRGRQSSVCLSLCL